jgi:glucose-6-phosphate-specific signal transduction histidine kinase
MYWQIAIPAVATALFAAVLSYAIARRYGWKPALVPPTLALVASIGMLWQSQGMGFRDGLGLIGAAMVFSAPTLFGALLGILVARSRKA